MAASPPFQRFSRKDIGWNGRDWTGPKSEYGRKLLQALGHGARVWIASSVWIEALENAIDTHDLSLQDDLIVVADVRYENEASWVWRNGGLVVKIVRPFVDRSGPEHQHVTETSIDTIDADTMVINDGTLDELHARLFEALKDQGFGQEKWRLRSIA